MPNGAPLNIHIGNAADLIMQLAALVSRVQTVTIRLDGYLPPEPTATLSARGPEIIEVSDENVSSSFFRNNDQLATNIRLLADHVTRLEEIVGSPNNHTTKAASY